MEKGSLTSSFNLSKAFSVFSELVNEFETGMLSSFNDVACDVTNSSTEYKVVCDLPGMNKQDIYIDYDETKNLLTIAATREETSKQEMCDVERKASFKRSLKMPGNIIWGKSKATYENGVLTLTVPKVENITGRRIMVA